MLNKKIILLTVATMTIASLFVGCGNNAPAKKEAFSGVKKTEQPLDPTGKTKDTIITEVNYNDGTPTSVNIDVKLEDGTMKSQLSQEGKYVMKKDEKHAWHDQINLLEESIKSNNFDLSKINIHDEAGHTDAVTGVSITVGSYLQAVQANLDEVTK